MPGDWFNILTPEFRLNEEPLPLIPYQLPLANIAIFS